MFGSNILLKWAETSLWMKKNMFRRREMIKERLLKTIKIFREKGAINPEGAMTLDELDLPSQFKRLMNADLTLTAVGKVLGAVDGKPWDYRTVRALAKRLEVL